MNHTGSFTDGSGVAGAHYYPTLHIAEVSDEYHSCGNISFGS